MGSSSIQIGPSISLYAHLTALREESDRRHDEVQFWREKFYSERDRRYTEVGIEREKALKIKEQADRDALALARADQTYKDERANNLRTQIEQERGNYATKDDMKALTEKMEAMIKPLTDFASRSRGGSAVWGDLAVKIGLIAGVITLIFKFVN